MTAYGRSRTLDSTLDSGPFLMAANGGALYKYSNEVCKVGKIATMEDFVTPNFQARMSNGDIIMNPCKLTKTERQSAYHIIRYFYYFWWEWHGEHAWKLERAYPTTLDARMDLAAFPSTGSALVSAYSKMNKSDVMGGEFLKDLGSTLGMIRKPFGSAQDLLARMGKARARRAGKTAKSFARATANTWLEYRMGWRPVVGDVKAIAKIVTRNRDKSFQQSRRVVRSSVDSPDVIYTGNTTSWLYDGYNTVNLNGVVKDTISCRSSAGVIFALVEPSSEAERWARACGLTAKDVPATAWECMPFSWVMDQFVGVGDWLQAVTPNPFVNVLGSWTSAEKIGTRVTSGTWSASGKSGPVSPHTYVSTQRIRNPNVPLPPYPLPKTRSLGVAQIADDLSAIGQKIITGLNGFRH